MIYEVIVDTYGLLQAKVALLVATEGEKWNTFTDQLHNIL